MPDQQIPAPLSPGPLVHQVVLVIGEAPMAFTVDRTTDKKKKRKLATNSTGYKIVKEELDKKKERLMSKKYVKKPKLPSLIMIK